MVFGIVGIFLNICHAQQFCQIFDGFVCLEKIKGCDGKIIQQTRFFGVVHYIQ